MAWIAHATTETPSVFDFLHGTNRLSEPTNLLRERAILLNRYCGAAEELPGAFANLANGELGGACENLPGSGPNGYCQHEIPRR